MKKIWIFIAVPLMLTSCTGNVEDTGVTKYQETQIESTEETVEDTVENTEDIQEEFVTYGIYRSSETEADADGDYELATFTDEYGNDFVATITEKTEKPEEFIEGKTYAVTHDEIMTMSLPGIYPHVYRIEEAEPIAEAEPDAGLSQRKPIMKVPTTEESDSE